MKIILYKDNPSDLIKKSESVIDITPELKQLAKDMYEIMINSNGIGLAAPQIGHLIRLIVLTDNNTPLYLFNPKIMKYSKELDYYNEGCLSFPNEFYNIKRPKSIDVKYRDINGKMNFGKFNGLTARIIQHEIDHLNGILFNKK